MMYNVLYHCLSLAVLIWTYLGSRGEKKKLATSLEVVYMMTALIIVSDCVWSVLDHYNFGNEPILYGVNMLYFIAEVVGIYTWALFVAKTLEAKWIENKGSVIVVSLPVVIIILMIITTPVTGFIFSIEDGKYVRGSLFYIVSLIKLGYLLAFSVYACTSASQEKQKYMKRKDKLLALYAIPVLVGGILQVVLGADLNCVAPVLGLAIIYKFGIANEAKDNVDLVKAIAKSYRATFIIDADNHTARALSSEGNYKQVATLTNTLSYEDVLSLSIKLNVMPEDRIRVERDFALSNVLKQLETKNTYTVIYKTNSESEQKLFNKATFMKAFSDMDRHELFLGIEKQEMRQLIVQEKEDLEEERENFERVKETFTTVIANVIEARDVDSGEHVLRVRSLTQYLCNQVMQDYPEYGLTPLKIRYITNGSALHDIGKIMIPDSILLKKGPLTKEEYEIMKTHCEKGCTILDKIPSDLDEEYAKYSREIVRWHHERYDGKGYPDGLSGDNIPISAQIVSLVDCFDALTSKRAYKDPVSKKDAFNMIYNEECGVFNIDLLDSFKKVLKQQYGKEFR